MVRSAACQSCACSKSEDHEVKCWERAGEKQLRAERGVGSGLRSPHLPGCPRGLWAGGLLCSGGWTPTKPRCPPVSVQSFVVLLGGIFELLWGITGTAAGGGRGMELPRGDAAQSSGADPTLSLALGWGLGDPAGSMAGGMKQDLCRENRPYFCCEKEASCKGAWFPFQTAAGSPRTGVHGFAGVGWAPLSEPWSSPCRDPRP